MTQQTAFFPLGEGMDLVTPMLTKAPGSVIASLNYEPVTGGYRRLTGYERFDGRTAPSAGGTRGSITTVPGSGPVRGVCYAGGKIFAVRDNAGGTAGIVYVATTGGWTTMSGARDLHFTSGGTTEIPLPGRPGYTHIVAGEVSGASATIISSSVSSGSWAGGDAVGIFTLSTVTGTFSAGENLDVYVYNAAGVIQSPAPYPNVATYSSIVAAFALPVGGEYHFVTHNFYGANDLERVYGVNGVGKGFLFDPVTLKMGSVTTGMAVDKPAHIAVHRSSLFFAFEGGSVQFSSVGDPLDWSATVGAGEIGIGSDVTGFLPLPNALAILGERGIFLLYGNDVTDYQLDTLTLDAGALAHTAQNAIQPLYMDDAGIRSLQASQNYANFTTGSVSQAVSPLIEDKLHDAITPSASLVCRRETQYWLFFGDGTGLIVYLGAKRPSILPFNIGVTVTCSCSAEINGEERLFVGASNGYVYELNKGTSFDGAAIEHYLRLPFNHFGKPQQMKTINKAVLDVEVDGAASLNLTAEYDYGSVPGSSTIAASLVTGGGAIDGLGSNELYYASQIETQAEAYLDGLCNNVSLKIDGSSATENPHKLTGVTYFISWRGLNR